MSLFERFREKALEIKKKTAVLYLALQSPDTGLPARALAIITIAYAMSPIDLIPDFIPVLGLIDDLILLPLLIMLTVRLIPDHVLAEAEKKLQENPPSMKKSTAAAIVIILIQAAVVLKIVIEIVKLF